jgi:hypothetical protein
LTEAVEILRGVVRGDVSPDQAADDLAEFVSLSLDGPEQCAKYLRAFDIKVPLLPADVAYTLKRYLGGLITEEELCRWATFITLMSVYQAPEHPTNEDHYDPLWDVVHNLAAPQVFGEIDSELVAEYLAQVEGLDN